LSDVKSENPRKIAGVAFLVLAFFVLCVGVYFVSQGKSDDIAQERERINKEIKDAVSYGQSGDYERAVALLKELVTKHPKNSDALYNYGVALRSVRKLSDADQVFQDLLEINSKDYEAWAERANLAVLENNLETAFDYLEKIPRGEGQLILRLRTDPQWQALEKHPRMNKIRSLQGLTKLNYQ